VKQNDHFKLIFFVYRLGHFPEVLIKIQNLKFKKISTSCEMSYRSTSASIKLSYNLKELREKVKTAKAEEKIFMITNGYEPLRQSLLARGWIEKLTENQVMLLPSTSEKYAIGNLLKSLPFHFIWQPKSRPIQNNFDNTPLINSIVREDSLDFTLKDGLDNCAMNLKWHHIEGVTDTNYQRSHIWTNRTAKDEFEEDFRRTALTSFVLFLNSFDDDFGSLFTTLESGFSTDCIDFAFKKIELLIRFEDHEDIDTSHYFDFCAKFPKNQKEFLIEFDQVVNRGKKFKFESEFLVETWKNRVKIVAEKVMEVWPHLRYDGFKNLWIVKPLGENFARNFVIFEHKIL
jgi:hypothetical protein